MNGSIGLLVVVIVVGVVVAVVLSHRAEQRHRAELREAARRAGWAFSERDDSYGRTWSGPPFQGRRGQARCVISGRHRGRDFVAFEYSYTTTSSNGTTTTTTTHRFAVWTLPLPAAAPRPLSVGPEGLFGGSVARAFGVDRLDVADEEFHRTFKIKCDDTLFGTAVLQPAVLEFLRGTGPWDWRFDGSTMIAFEKGRLESPAIRPKLDAMSDLLDRVPSGAWGWRGSQA